MAIRSKLTASALTLALISAALPAFAGLGRMHVQSGLGQPFRAEIDLNDLRAPDLGKVQVSLASRAAFTEMQMDYPEFLAGLQFSVDRKSNGKTVARITSNQPVNTPFLFMLIELNDGGGRTFKEFTAVLDPSDYASTSTANGEQAKPAASPAPVSSPVAAPAAQPAPAVVAAAPAAPATPATPVKPAAATPPEAKPAATPSAAAKPATAKPAGVAKPNPETNHDTYTVKQGDSLSAVAQKLKPTEVSLEQAIVGLYRANPTAFGKRGVNTLLAGSTLSVPETDTLKAITPKDIGTTLRSQTKDWRRYADAIAAASNAAAPRDPVANAARPAPKSTVTDTDPPINVGEGRDVVKLTKADGKPTTGQDRVSQLEEEVITREKSLKDASDRIVTLEKQVGEMSRLLTLRSQAGVAAKPTKPDPATEKPFSLQDNLPLVAGLGSALLLAAGFIWSRRRRKDAPTTFGPTAAAAAKSTEDPLVEADTLIRYGRLDDAETLLLGALVDNMNRQELRLKLLEVYAAIPREDSFHVEATTLKTAVGEDSPLWEKARAMGLKLSRLHPLYGGGGREEGVADDVKLVAPTPVVPVAAVAAAATAVAAVTADLDPFGSDDLMPDQVVMQGGGFASHDKNDVLEQLPDKPLLNYDFQAELETPHAAPTPAPAPAEEMSMDGLFDAAPVVAAPRPELIPESVAQDDIDVLLAANTAPAFTLPDDVIVADDDMDGLFDMDPFGATPLPTPVAEPTPAVASPRFELPDDVIMADDMDMQDFFDSVALPASPVPVNPPVSAVNLDLPAIEESEAALQALFDSVDQISSPATTPVALDDSNPAEGNTDFGFDFNFDNPFGDEAAPAPKPNRNALAAALANAPDLPPTENEEALLAAAEAPPAEPVAEDVPADANNAQWEKELQAILAGDTQPALGGDVESLLELATVYSDMGDLEGAQDVLTEYISKNPNGSGKQDAERLLASVQTKMSGRGR